MSTYVIVMAIVVMFGLVAYVYIFLTLILIDKMRRRNDKEIKDMPTKNVGVPYLLKNDSVIERLVIEKNEAKIRPLDMSIGGRRDKVVESDGDLIPYDLSSKDKDLLNDFYGRRR